MDEYKKFPVYDLQQQETFNDMLKTYEKLYDIVKHHFGNEKFSRFFPLCGMKYKEEMEISKSSMEPRVRLMLVGRSVNGWTEISEKTSEEFSIAAAYTILEEGFDWLRDDGKGKETYIRDYDQKECRYNINQSSFFRCTRKILNRLNPITVIDQRWFDYIVWSNLYTIAPPYKGNAEGKLQDVQVETSKKLLQKQIELYKPTHILFITDWDWWFERFTDVFPMVKKVGDSTMDNVVGKGIYGNSKVVVTVRPDRTRPNRPNEEMFVNDVVKCFGE